MAKEREIKLHCGQSIDEVVYILLKEKDKGNHVFCNFNDVILHSDNVTLDSAYKSICGCSKEEFYEKNSRFSNTSEKEKSKTNEEIIQELFEINAENAIRDMKMSKLLFLTKDGKFYSHIANEYIKKMDKYSVYCKKDKKENWTQTIENLIYQSGELSDECILSELRIKEYTGIIMEQLANGKTMKEIKKIVCDQGHTGFTISLLGQNMINYSTYGLEFAEKVIGTYATDSSSELCKTYKKEIRKQKNSK